VWRLRMRPQAWVSATESYDTSASYATLASFPHTSDE
jgi:hypothetical protein